MTDSPAAAKARAPRRKAAESPSAAEQADAQRLHKILAQAGVGSRRACELLILEGRVTVDGEVVRELGTKVDPAAAKIAVDGQRIRPEPNVYYLVYKPKGYVSTSDDPSGRPLVLDLVPKARERIFIVGRLDRHSEGLMLLTNDGALAQRLTHPSYGVEKTYRVTVAGDAGRDVVDKLTEGVWLAEGKVRARRARIVAHRGNVTILEVVLAEGKNREIRRMLARLDHKVLSLLRVAIGPLQLKGLSEGAWRSLSASEVEHLRTSTSAEDTADEDHQPAELPTHTPRARSGDRYASGAARRGDREPDRKPGRFGRAGAGSSERRGFEKSDSPRPPARQRPEPAEHAGDEEEIVFTDRMDLGESPSRPEPRPRPSRPRDRSDDDRGDRRPRGRSDDDRGDRRPRGRSDDERGDRRPRGRYDDARGDRPRPAGTRSAEDRGDRRPRGRYEESRGDRPRSPGTRSDQDRGDRRPLSRSEDDRGDRRPRGRYDEGQGERRVRARSDEDRGDRRPRGRSDEDRGDRRPRGRSDEVRGDRLRSQEDRGDRRPRGRSGEDRDERRVRARSDDDRGDRRPRGRSDEERGDRPRPPRARSDEERGDRPRPPRARSDEERGDRPRPPRARSDEDRGERRERGEGGERPRGGNSVGKGRPRGGRDDRPDQPRRTILGQPREPGKPGPKRRGGPSRSLPPRRRRPKA